MAKRKKRLKTPLPRFRYLILAALAREIDAEIVEDADIFSRDLSLYDLHLVEWGDAIMQQAYKYDDDSIDWGPLAPPTLCDVPQVEHTEGVPSLPSSPVVQTQATLW